MRVRPAFKRINIFVTRGVRGRQFRLRPCKQTNEIVGYTLAVLATRYKIEISSVCVMSDHWHLTVHDANGEVSNFTRDAHHFITKQINAAFADTGSMWDSRQTNHVYPELPTDLLERIAYTMANPVKAGLVKLGKSWPGIRKCWPDPPTWFTRPAVYFDSESDSDDWPECAELVLHRPRGFEELPDNELAIRVRGAVEHAEGEARRAVEKSGRGFCGRSEVLKQSRNQCATSERPSRRVIPEVACRDRELRIARLLERKRWRAVYAERLSRWRNGERDVLFPPGTFKMRVVHNVRVEPG